jgi:tetratricopeptide (TPR) repeat protein
MLFDLRGKGRRRTVRIIYTGLALLMGVGLVGFGVGGGFGGGGILNAASNSEGSSAASFAAQIKKYRKLTKQKPKDAAAWEQLTKAILHEAGGVTQNGITSQGKALYAEASESWNKYLELNPPKESSELAEQMYTVYSEEGLKEPSQAVQALQILVAARPTSAALWAALAENAYKAKNKRIGALASEKAVALAPAADRTRIKTELEEAAKNPSGEKTYTTTTNGKTYVVKKAANGTYTGTQSTPTTTTAITIPSSSSTTTKK